MKRSLRHVIRGLQKAILKLQALGERMENFANRMLAWNERLRAKWA